MTVGISYADQWPIQESTHTGDCPAPWRTWLIFGWFNMIWDLTISKPELDILSRCEKISIRGATKDIWSWASCRATAEHSDWPVGEENRNSTRLRKRKSTLQNLISFWIQNLEKVPFKLPILNDSCAACTVVVEKRDSRVKQCSVPYNVLQNAGEAACNPL